MAEKHQDDNIIGKAVREAREKAGISQARLGEMAGTTQQSVDRIESGETKHSRYLPSILSLLGITPAALDRSGKLQPMITNGGLTGSKDFPVFGAVEGGRGAIIVSKEPVEYVDRPAPLATVKDAYGVIVVEESMVPAFKPGDTALVHPHRPPRPEDDIVLYSNPDLGDGKAIIKTLVRSRADTWLLREYSPRRREFELKKIEWPICHVVIGKFSRG